MPKITPFFWFDNNAEEAMNFYTSIFKNSKIGSVSRYGDAGPGPKGSVLVATISLEGQDIMLLNGGPHYKLSPAALLVVNCDTQEEIDYHWDKLTAGGGKSSRCGWLEDKFGLSWQIVPNMLAKLMSSGESEKANRMMQELLKMDKLVIADLQRAHEG
jgi:predicted 3-demethylubiquinone-9 3-methyltransferase (glyoxalase superfamily)